MLAQQLQQRVTVAEEAARFRQEPVTGIRPENAQLGQSDDSNNYVRGQPAYRRNGWGARGRPGRDTCNRCGEVGHWSCHCTRPPPVAGDATQPSYRRLNSRKDDETYLEASIDGRRTFCLLDSGCQFSTLLARFVAPSELQPADIQLFAVNGSELPVVGRINVALNIQGMEIPTVFLVSDEVDEVLLGIDFLVANNVRWKFSEGRVEIHDMVVPLLPRPVRGRVRRVYASERVVVQPSSEFVLPVALSQVSRLLPAADWLVEPHEIRRGVIVARTLDSDDSESCAVRVINVNDSPVELKGGACIGEAQIHHGYVIDQMRDAEKQSGS